MHICTEVPVDTYRGQRMSMSTPVTTQFERVTSYRASGTQQQAP
jgi:hypothetical protein